MGHDYIGHDYVGHNYICHNYIGTTEDWDRSMRLGLPMSDRLSGHLSILMPIHVSARVSTHSTSLDRFSRIFMPLNHVAVNIVLILFGSYGTEHKDDETYAI